MSQLNEARASQVKAQLNVTAKKKIAAVTAQQLVAEEDVQAEKSKVKEHQRTIAKLQGQMAERGREIERLREEIMKEKEQNTSLCQQLKVMKKNLQEEKDFSRDLLLQSESAHDKNTSQLHHIPLGPQKVKGIDHPLSNFFKCDIKAFNTSSVPERI